MAATLIDLDVQASGKVFSFGTTAASGEALITLNKGTAAVTTVVLDVKGSQNIGGDLNVIGNINFGGTLNETAVTNLAIADINVTLNKGGTTATAAGAGLFIEGDTATTIGKLLYDGSLISKWKIGDGTTQVEIVTVSGAQTLTNKLIAGSQITSAVANATLAATVTTNANLTGVITSSGNVTSIAAQTGTGTTFVTQTSPTLVTPNIGVAIGTSLATTGAQTSGVSASADGNMIWLNATNSFTQAFRGSAVGASIVYVLPTTAPVTGQVLTASTPSTGVSTMSWTAASAGTVTSVSVVTANGVSGTVATASSTPAITLVLGAITPSSVVATGAISGSNLSGTNTGDQTSVSGNSGSTTLTAITDDVVTNAVEYITWVGAISGNQAQKVSSTKLTFNPSTGALSSTSFSGAGTGLTGIASGLTAGTVTTNANLTGGVTSVGNVATVVTNANLTGDITSVGNVTTLTKYQRSTVVSGTQDGVNKVFTLSNILKTGSEQVFIQGQLLTPGSTNDYIYDGNVTITFQAAFIAPSSTKVLRVYGTF